MGRRTKSILFPLILILMLNGCYLSKPKQTGVGPGLTPAVDLKFELLRPPSQAIYEVQREPFVVVQDNCGGDEPLDKIFRQSLELPKHYELGPAKDNDLANDISAYTLLIDTIISRRYGLKATQQIEGSLPLHSGPWSHGRTMLRWVEVWDQNALNVILDGRIVESLSLRVRLSAQLVREDAQDELCAGPQEAAKPQTLSAHIGAPKTENSTRPSPPPSFAQPTETPTTERPAATATLTPRVQTASGATPTGMRSHTPVVPLSAVAEQGTATPSQTRTITPGSDNAIALVRDYLEHLGSGRWVTAYRLLHPAYQRRIPYETYLRKQISTTRIVAHEIEAERIDATHERVRVLMTVTTVQRGKESSADWWGYYDVITVPGRRPYERLILSTRTELLPTEKQ